ncbi:MAG: dipeptidase [Trueperaceae bacterium]|nr:dipeptidase [Trueperaceae bacterium]
MTHDLDAVLGELQANLEAYRAELATFIAIPTVSTDPDHAGDVERGAQWVADRLRAAGDIAVEVVHTGHHPAVLGRWDGAEDAPTVLVYGHLDVQPPDPLEAWHSPPFELTERDGRWYARGVSDDKASMLIPILVAEAFFQRGAPPVNLRFLFEAEEEIGSPSLPGLVRKRADDLACDVALSADGGMWRADLPSLTTRARGLTALEVQVEGPGKDLHSGRHGGAVHNPLHALVDLLSGLHDADGRVAVAGFYDDVLPPDADSLAAVEALPFDDDDYLREVGAPAPYGEVGFGTLARRWLRPTLELNGVAGGYQGPGIKTVLPREASAKITCRLVPNQEPETVLARVRQHLEAAAPPSVRVQVTLDETGARAYAMTPDHPALRVAEEVLEHVFGRAPVRVGMGGSVPILTTFREALGVDTLFFSFSTSDEDIHAPNEFYRPERFAAGLQAWARLWDGLARSPDVKRAAAGEENGPST